MSSAHPDCIDKASAVVLVKEEDPSSNCTGGDEGAVHEEEEAICGDKVQRILAQPREEMNIVRLLNADPVIRKVFMRPKKDLQSQETVGEDDHYEDRMNMESVN